MVSLPDSVNGSPDFAQRITIVSFPFELDHIRGCHRCLDLIGDFIFYRTVLQRSEPVAVNGGIGITLLATGQP